MPAGRKWIAIAAAVAGSAAIAIAAQHRALGPRPALAAPGAGSEASTSAASPGQPWARQGFRDGETWRDLGPSPDTNEGANTPAPAPRR